MSDLQVELLTELTPARRQAILSRSQEDVSAVLEVVAPILAALRADGDAESLRQHQQFKADITAADLLATPEEIEAAYRVLDPKVTAALKTAAANIEKFHQAQLEREMWAMEVQPGILAGRLSRPIDRVGCYIPGGLASYPSSALMNIIPAKVAGVAEIVAATPPGPGMAVNPATLVAAHLAGASQLFKLGGPWAIGSLAYGTKTVPRVDKIVGPGNKYVTAAKLLVFGQVDIDSPAGPSEALILADDTAEARLVAVDFLSQVEHDPEAAAVLVTTDADLARAVVDIITRNCPTCPGGRSSERPCRSTPRCSWSSSWMRPWSLPTSMPRSICRSSPGTLLPCCPASSTPAPSFWGRMPRCRWATTPREPTTCCPRGAAPGCSPACPWMISSRNPPFSTLPGRRCRSLKDTVITLAEHEGLLLHARAVAERFRDD